MSQNVDFAEWWIYFNSAKSNEVATGDMHQNGPESILETMVEEDKAVRDETESKEDSSDSDQLLIRIDLAVLSLMNNEKCWNIYEFRSHTMHFN